MTISKEEQKKIRARISRYERNFKRDPSFRDGSGSRFLIGPLFLLLNDLDGALKHYIWFGKEFSDSSDEPLHTLCWALSLFRAGNLEGAIYRLRRAHLANTYLIPAILKVPHKQPEVKRHCNWEDEDTLDTIEPRFYEIWSQNEIDWLRATWEDAKFQEMVQTHKDLTVQLEREPIGPKRNILVETLSALADRAEAKGRRLRLVTSEDDSTLTSS